MSIENTNKSKQNQKNITKFDSLNLPVKKIKPYSSKNNFNNNGKQASSKLTEEKNIKVEGSEQSKTISLSNRYQLNADNYVTELHKALIKECKENLLDSYLLNIKLDVDILSDVTYRTVKAIENRKVFSVLGYFPKICEELKNRGWIEKRDPYRPPINYSQYLKSTPNMVNWIESPPSITSTSTNEAVYERLKNEHAWSILKNNRSDLIFVTRNRLINWSTISDLSTVSQLTRHTFCTKNGLALCLETYKNTATNLMFPRCHYIRNKSDYNEFIDDYIITALVGTLKIIVESIEKNKQIFSEEGKVPYELINFVELYVFLFLNKRQNGSTEKDVWKFESQKELWDEFIVNYQQLIDNNTSFYHEYNYELELNVYARCKYLIDNVKIYCPQHYMDGNTNMWIIKPTANCSGHGIIMSRDLKKIKEKIVVTEGSRNNFILQKYIEKPLLVNNCKIDLRQWFLVTNMDPVVVWMYKEGYVRFCANSFAMKNMHESVHLSNVRLQLKYRKTRSPNVPEECMWDYRELQNHLAIIGQEYVWDDLIFPGMSESIYAVLSAAKNTLFYRVNTFQLFGADFVITDTFVPYLIEINSIPGLNPSTSVIANLAPMLLKDIVKVVVDYKENPEADTGLFVKVIPELLEPTNNCEPRQVPNVSKGIITDPSLIERGQHDIWVNKVNNALAAIRYRLNAHEANDRAPYLGGNRNTLLHVSNANAPKFTEKDRDEVLNNTVLTPQEKITTFKKMFIEPPDESSVKAQQQNQNR